MKEIRQTIKERLEEIHPRAFYLTAPNDAVFPYLVYTVNITDLNDHSGMVTLDVDGWGNEPDTTELETLMDAVRKGLNRTITINESIVLSFYLERQLSLEDPEIDLHRRTNIFIARSFERT